MIALHALGVVVGLALAIWASRRALGAATEVGSALGMPPFVIGMTIVAVGTDLPEIANSIIASALDHGDINVGNAVGSVVTQSTLVLGAAGAGCSRRASSPRSRSWWAPCSWRTSTSAAPTAPCSSRPGWPGRS